MYTFIPPSGLEIFRWNWCFAFALYHHSWTLELMCIFHEEFIYLNLLYICNYKFMNMISKYIMLEGLVWGICWGTMWGEHAALPCPFRKRSAHPCPQHSLCIYYIYVPVKHNNIFARFFSIIDCTVFLMTRWPALFITYCTETVQ